MFGPLRVLVVDDCTDMTDTMLQLLKLWGYAGIAACNAPGALEAARLYHPQVILLDLAMPGMTGVEVAKRLREASGPEKMLLVAVTGYPHVDKLCRDAGFDHVLAKPVDVEALERLLACWCAARMSEVDRAS